MMEYANILSFVQEGAQAICSAVSSFLSGLGINFSELSTGGMAVVLAAVWYFARIIRTVVSILFTICVLLLVLQLSGHVDLSSAWQTLQGWFSQSAS